MTVLFYIVGWLAFMAFAFLAVWQVLGYKDASPLHIRWELYPVPHEGERAEHGGSFMEEKDWWEKKRHVDHLGDIKGIITEVLFLHATWEHNPKLWARSYPFHLGMYMLMGGTIILVVASLIGLIPGVAADGCFMTVVANLINGAAIIGTLCIFIGGIALMQRRMSDPGLKRYTTKEHYLNLGAFTLFGLAGFLACLTAPQDGGFFKLAHGFLAGLFNFGPVNNVPFIIHMALGFLLLILIPTTNMRHLVLKYYMYHDIRWGDVPSNFSEKNREKVMESLQFKVDWAASHIGSKGQKNWVEVATSNPEIAQQ